jgi:hypothetical protein
MNHAQLEAAAASLLRAMSAGSPDTKITMREFILQAWGVNGW